MKPTSSKPTSFELMHKIATDSPVQFTPVPNGLMKFAEFMHRVGTPSEKPASWKELCLPEAAAKAGR